MNHAQGTGDKIFHGVNNFFMFFVFFITLFPFWYTLVLSFNDGQDAIRGGIYFWPRLFTLDNYRAVFSNNMLLRAFIVTSLRTIVGTAASVLFTSMVAYAMAQSFLTFRKFYMIVGTITMFFSGGLIPYFLLIRDLGLRNNYLVYIIPNLFSFWNMIIIMTFFRTLPKELSESAEIDGAGYMRIFVTIVLPLSKPILAAMALFNGVFHWNEFFSAILFIDNRDMLPIQTILFRIIAENEASAVIANVPDIPMRRRVTSEAVKLATMMVTTLPIIMVYPFLQKYFVKGILIGSIKG